jgi:SWI/SNF-related matrix-associated actin-dependent regulator of chromatin subfamily A-like protein 1
MLNALSRPSVTSWMGVTDMVTLFPTQIEDSDFLAGFPHGSLFSEPGTGKTLTTLEAARVAGVHGGLIIAPPIALRMWGQEIENYLGARAQVIRAGKEPLDPMADFYVTSYAIAAKRPDLAGMECVILDEADALKNLSSQRTKAIYGNRASGRNCIIHGSTYVWPLTGTPIRRYPDDLYPWFRALHPRVLKEQGITSLVAFTQTFCVAQMRRFHPRMPMKPVVMGSRNESLLRSLIYGVKGPIKRRALAVRRTIDDVAGFMPPLVERNIDVSYVDSSALREATMGVDLDKPDEAIMATARRLLGVAKAKSCAEYVLDVQEAENRPVLVLYWHKEVGDMLAAALSDAGKSWMRIDGSTPQSRRSEAEDLFNKGHVAFMLGQIQSMGVALNLQRASNHVVFVERDWSPSSQEQGYKRVWRLGQQSKVLVDICLADHLVDEALTMVNERKLKIMGKVL